MKYRWLKITGNLIWGTNDLKVADLANRKSGMYDAIIDLEQGTQYDPEANDWVKIEGDQ